MEKHTLWILLPFLSGWIFASFGVYWIHRLMHFGKVYAGRHIEHHKKNSGQGWVHEFLDYVRPASVPIILTAIPWAIHSWQDSVRWIIGVVLCIAVNAFTHEVSHTNPSLAFWVNRPVHYFHHHHHQWKQNFGFANSYWDKLFGTFKDDQDWHREKINWRDYLKIKWV
jgi:sterol desaturase/sphingolipid hydroxylase (fatty acid hydroxylase superfamily)